MDLPRKPATLGCGLVAPEKTTLSAQLLIVISLLAANSGEHAPNLVEPPWMVGSTLSSPQLAEGLALQPEGGQAPWCGNLSTLTGSDTALSPVDAPNSPLSGGIDQSADDHSLADFYDPFSRQFAYGSAGVQPYRLGWFSYDDFVLMPGARASVGGNFQNLEWNTWLRHSRQLPGSLVFAWTAALNSKFWTGPTGINFPADGDQLLSDFQLSSNWTGAWNWQIGMTPQIDSDFSRTLNSNAFMFDARAVALYRPSPEWTLAIGAAFWNRASDHLIPYGGVIWAPNDRWEFRLLFPRSRISYYVGDFHGFETWGYVSGEYNLEAYQLDIQGPHISVRGELSDYRLLKGFNLQRGRWNFFWEGGAVFDRRVRFRGSVGDFGINEGLMFRTGITY
jgi:hypothetical protein